MLSNGSWKTIWMRDRSLRNCAVGNRLMSCPLKRIVPSLASISRRMQRPTVVLPEPLSPTSATASPRPIVKDTSFTAVSSLPPFTGKRLTRRSTSSTGATLPPQRFITVADFLGQISITRRRRRAQQLPTIKFAWRGEEPLHRCVLDHPTAAHDQHALAVMRNDGEVAADHDQTGAQRDAPRHAAGQGSVPKS